MRTSDALDTVVVVGGSLAGLRSCEALRAEGFAGKIIVIGAEPHLPYDRPPLSKQFLQGTFDEARIALRSGEKLASLGLDLRLGVRALGLDTKARVVESSDGKEVRYDGLIIATGASPRKLPGTGGISGMLTLRMLDDARLLRECINTSGCHLVVIGGGFLGMEVAASAKALGAIVSVVEPMSVPLGRVLGPLVGSALAAEHKMHGVSLHLNVGVEEVVGEQRVEAVRLSDGTELRADVVVVAIGVAPETGWLAGSGLVIDNGIVCDRRLRAGPDVFAAGDVACWPLGRVGDLVRLEHWTNATEQARHAVRALLGADGGDEDFAPIPYFWSDHFDLKIQAIGLPHPDDDVEIVTGSLEERRFVACYGRAGRLTAIVGFGQPRELMQRRHLLERRASFIEAVSGESA